MITAYFSLNLLDLALTWAILEFGGWEANPLLSSCLGVGGFPLLALVKMGLVLAVSFILAAVKHILPADRKRWALVFSLPVTVMMVLVCVWNAIGLWELAL